MEYSGEKAEELNADHHRRMAHDARAVGEDRVREIKALDGRSRDKLLWAMKGCVERHKMADGPTRLLEIGAGRAGHKDALLQQLGVAEYIGVEVVREVAEASSEHGVLHMAFEDAPENWDGAFHFIYSRHVMEHVLDVVLAMKTLKRLLAPNGVIGAVTPHYFPDPEPAHVTQMELSGWMNAYVRGGLKPVYATIEDFVCQEAHLVCVHDNWPLVTRSL
jgi:SAM-dependent methyltransferase